MYVALGNMRRVDPMISDEDFTKYSFELDFEGRIGACQGEKEGRQRNSHY